MLCESEVKTIGVIADLHTGSNYSPFPEEYYTTTGNCLSASMNEGQKKLLEYWKDFTNKFYPTRNLTCLFLSAMTYRERIEKIRLEDSLPQILRIKNEPAKH